MKTELKETVLSLYQEQVTFLNFFILTIIKVVVLFYVIYYAFSMCFPYYLLFVICALSYTSLPSLKLDFWLLCQHNYNYCLTLSSLYIGCLECRGNLWDYRQLLIDLILL